MREQIILDEEQMYLHHEQMILKSEQNIRPCGVDPQNLAEEQGGVAAAVDSGVPEEDHARQGVGGRGALNRPLRLPRPSSPLVRHSLHNLSISLSVMSSPPNVPREANPYGFINEAIRSTHRITISNREVPIPNQILPHPHNHLQRIVIFVLPIEPMARIDWICLDLWK